MIEWILITICLIWLVILTVVVGLIKYCQDGQAEVLQIFRDDLNGLRFGEKEGE